MPVPPVTMHFPGLPARHANGCLFVVDMGLVWDATDPATVRMLIVARGGNTACWWMERGLLTAGLDAPTGHGDISVMPDLTKADGKSVELVLRDPQGLGGNISLPLRTVVLRQFLNRTYEQTPAGAEADTYAQFDPTELTGGAA